MSAARSSTSARASGPSVGPLLAAARRPRTTASSASFASDSGAVLTTSRASAGLRRSQGAAARRLGPLAVDEVALERAVSRLLLQDSSQFAGRRRRRARRGVTGTRPAISSRATSEVLAALDGERRAAAARRAGRTPSSSRAVDAAPRTTISVRCAPAWPTYCRLSVVLVGPEPVRVVDDGGPARAMLFAGDRRPACWRCRSARRGRPAEERVVVVGDVAGGEDVGQRWSGSARRRSTPLPTARPEPRGDVDVRARCRCRRRPGRLEASPPRS